MSSTLGSRPGRLPAVHEPRYGGSSKSRSGARADGGIAPGVGELLVEQGRNGLAWLVRQALAEAVQRAAAQAVVAQVLGKGPLRVLDENELAQLLDTLSAAHESRLAPKPPWTRAKLTPGRFESMLKAIVGYELRIEALRGTRKLGQNKSDEERAGAAAGLAPLNPALAALMRRERRP